MLLDLDVNLKGTDCTARESIGKLMRSANETDENTKTSPGWINSVEMQLSMLKVYQQFACFWQNCKDSQWE